MPLQCEWPIWDFHNPPSGIDGIRWSARWFRRVAVDQYAREAPDVQDAVAVLEAIENCAYVEVLAETLDDGGVGVTAVAGLGVEGVYESPTRRLRLQASDRVTKRLLSVLALSGPEAPFNADSNRRAREVGEGRPDAQFEAQTPLLAWSRLRDQGPGEVRRDLLRNVKDGGLRYRGLKDGRPFTDMWATELARVVGEARSLADAVQRSPDDFWPLLPGEMDRMKFPPPVRNRPGDYEYRVSADEDYVDDLRALRSLDALAHDLTLLRLGYDPDDSKTRGALRTQLSREQHHR